MNVVHLPSEPIPAAIPATIRVAVVEDDPGFLSLITEAVTSQPDMQLTAVASTLAEGLAWLAHADMDVLLVDLGLPDGSGIELIRQASALRPECEVLVSTAFGDELSVIRSFEAGASGYLLKQQDVARLAEDIRHLRAGGSPISPLIARQILSRLKPGLGGAGPAQVPATQAVAVPIAEDVSLSEREQQVLGYVTKGFTAEEIAGLMGVSRHTVLTYVRRTYRKLKVNSKAEAIFEARLHGLIP